MNTDADALPPYRSEAFAEDLTDLMPAPAPWQPAPWRPVLARAQARLSAEVSALARWTVAAPPVADTRPPAPA